MAASLTLSAPVVAADGKTVTATIAGGTAPYSISSTAGLTPHLTAGDANGFVVSSATVSGATLTMVCGSSIGTGESIRLDIATSATLTDSAANTPTGQTNIVATNNSAVTVTTVAVNATQFELAGLYIPSGGKIRRTGSTESAVDNFSVEFVADATEITAIGYSASPGAARVDGATASTNLTANGFWSFLPVASGLTAGKHLVLLDAGDYFAGVRLVGGASTVTSVGTTKYAILANTAGYLGVPQATPVRGIGTYRVNITGDGAVVNAAYGGFEINCQISGASGLEVSSVSAAASQWATSVDGGIYGALVAAGDAPTNNTSNYVPLAAGLNPGASHTIASILVGAATSTTTKYVRAINGAVITAASSAGATTLTVGSANTLAVGDWVRIDHFGNREWRQVTAISGTTVTLNTALAKAHAVGAEVTSYMASAATITAWTRRGLVNKVVAMGDSNTQALSEFGAGTGGAQTGTADASGNYYSTYDPRQSPIFYAADALGDEVINLGIQGNTAAAMVSRQADIGTFAHGAADYITIWAGTNDINSTTTPAAFQASIESLVTAAEPSLRAGGKVILMPPGTPSTTNASGLNLSTALSALQAVAANHPTTTVVATNLLNGLVAGDYNGLHYYTSGRQKIAANLSPYIGGASVSPALIAGMFAAA